MRFIFITLLLFIGFKALASEEESKVEVNAFAKVNGSEQWKNYEIFVPDKHGDVYLTSITLSKENSLLVYLDFDNAFTYPNYKQAYFGVSANLADEYDIHLRYSTTENGGLVTCGGYVIKTNMKELLSSKQPKEVIPPSSKIGLQ